MKKALLVGINDYGQNITSLKGCINDASALESIIRSHGNGSPNFSTKLLTDIKTKSELKGAIKDLFSGSNDIALFYFSGHGHFNELGGYLITPDAKDHDEGVSMAEILQLANDSKSKDKIIILDCCHSGAFGTPKDNNGRAQLNEGISILAASRDSEASIEINGHGVFTSLLLDALSGGAADLRGHISPGGVYAYIDQALGPWDQRPVFKTNVTRFTSLREISPQVSLETLREIIKYFPQPQEEYDLNPSYEETNSKEVEHEVIKPYAVDQNVRIFKTLQKLVSVGLVVPVGEDHMYFAAMNSKACRLTTLGHHYWRLAKEGRI
jgi:hypothetical protein